jgi:hypothetical protein
MGFSLAVHGIYVKGSFLDALPVLYSEVMALVVQAASRRPLACRAALGSLCTVPYRRSEERCLVRSGLVSLLDRLCARAGLAGTAIKKPCRGTIGIVTFCIRGTGTVINYGFSYGSGTGTRIGTVIKRNHKRCDDKFLGNNAASI